MILKFTNCRVATYLWVIKPGLMEPGGGIEIAEVYCIITRTMHGF